MTTTNTAQLFPRPVSNATAPNEAPKAVPIIIDFSASPSQTLDLTILRDQGYLKSVQAIFVDNSANGSSATITVQSGQSLVIPPNSQAYLPILAPTPVHLLFASAGSVAISIQLLNVPMPSAVWSTLAPVSFPVTGGKVQVQDVILEGAIASGFVQSQCYAFNGTALAQLLSDASGRLIATTAPVALTSRSATTVAATSTQLAAANAARSYLLIKAPETADLWINPLGGVAAIGGADCFKIASGTQYESANRAWNGLINYYCATGALQFAAAEG